MRRDCFGPRLRSGSGCFPLRAASAQQLEPRAYAPEPHRREHRRGAVRVPDRLRHHRPVPPDPERGREGQHRRRLLRPDLLLLRPLRERPPDAALRLGQGHRRRRRADADGDALGPGRHELAVRDEHPRRPGADAAGVRAARLRRRRSARASPSRCRPGQYDGTKLINIGTNRWAFKPELGLVHPGRQVDLRALHGRLVLHGQRRLLRRPPSNAGRRPRSPGRTSIYTFLPGLWLSLDGTWYAGGRDDASTASSTPIVSRTRASARPSAFPLGHGHVLKLAWAKGATVRIGQNFTTYGLTYQFRWF